jgi:hypothetical protein
VNNFGNFKGNSLKINVVLSAHGKNIGRRIFGNHSIILVHYFGIGHSKSWSLVYGA